MDSKVLAAAVARLVLDSSIVINENSSLSELEAMAFCKFDAVSKTELLVAEIFTGQIPLSIFLSERGQTNALDQYYIEIYNLLLNKYGFFAKDPQAGVELFEIILQQRYPVYYAVTDMNGHFTREIAKKVSEILEEKGGGMFTLGLSGVLTSLAVAVKKFTDEAAASHNSTSNA